MSSALSGPMDWTLRYIKTYLFLFFTVWCRLGSGGLWEDEGPTGSHGASATLALLYMHDATTLAQTVISAEYTVTLL